MNVFLLLTSLSLVSGSLPVPLSPPRAAVPVPEQRVQLPNGRDSELPTYQSKLLSRFPGIRHAFFTRNGGASTGDLHSLQMSFGKPEPRATTMENYKRVAAWLPVDYAGLVITREVHSNLSVLVRAPFESGGPGTDLTARPNADGMVTTRREFALGIVSADCAPILFYYGNPRSPVVGACHAGMVGAINGMPQATLTQMRMAVGGTMDTGRLVVAIGPMVRNGSLIVNSTIYTLFTSRSASYARYFTALDPGASRYTLDLPAFLVDRIVEWGVPRDNVEDLAMDTYALPDEFYSYEYTLAHGIPTFGNQISVIKLA